MESFLLHFKLQCFKRERLQPPLNTIPTYKNYIAEFEVSDCDTMNVDQVTFYIEGAEIRPIIKMPTSATILQLKEEIKEHINVPVARQNLSYYETKLMDCHTIKHYNFGPFAGIQLAIETDPNQMDYNITVTCPAFKISLKVNQMDTVIKLKQKIGEMWGIQTEDVTLWHLSRRMQDDLPLLSYYIIEGSDVEFTRTGHDS